MLKSRGKPEAKIADFNTAHLTVHTEGHCSEPAGCEHVQTFAKIEQLASSSAPS